MKKVIHYSIQVVFALYTYIVGPVLSLLFASGRSSCRFSPSCSEYSRQAFLTYGFKKGSVLTYKRLIKCHSFNGQSGYDPIV